MRSRLACIALGATLAVPALAGTAIAADDVFLPYVPIELPSGARAVAVGDVTGDARDDIVLTTGYANDPVTDFRLVVLAQGADGLLEVPVSYATAGWYGAPVDSVDIGDIDGDGRTDVVVGVDRVGIQVFPGLADGTLGTGVLSPHPNSTIVRVGQLHPLGGLDVAGIGWGSQTVTVFSDPGGGLDGMATYPVAHNGWDDLEVGDLNGDGRDDMVVMSGQGTGPNFSILHQAAGGGFGGAVPYSVYDLGVLTRGIGLGDTNGDGRTDVVASYGGNQPSSRVALWVQLADGSLDIPVIHGSYDIPSPVELADIDGDGRDDAVTLHSGWMRAGVYLGREAGVLDLEQLFELPYTSHYGAHGLAVGDVNSDGWPDVVAAAANSGLVILSNSQVFQPTEPGAPTLTSATAGAGSATLAWEPPAYDGGSPLTSYYAEAQPGGAYCLVSATNCIIAGLTNGTTYSFTVRAGNEIGLGVASNALSATPVLLPSVPRNLATSPNLAAGVGLSWAAPSVAGEPALQGYRIYRGSAGGPLALHATVNATALSLTDAAVVNGGTYTYQVAAFSAYGEGPRTATATAQRGIAPGAPRSPTATTGPKGITLAWTAPSTNGGAPVTLYRIYRGTFPGGVKTLIGTVNGSVVTYVDKAVAKKTRYYYWITAVNILGEGPTSPEVSATAR